MLIVRFTTLQGKFAVLPAEFRYDSLKAALAAVTDFATAAGYRNVKAVEDIDSIRFTATTPGGRGGRNVAFADYAETF